MEHALKEKRQHDSGGARQVSQPDIQQGAFASHINSSPRMMAQRQTMQSLFGGAVQLQGNVDNMRQKQQMATGDVIQRTTWRYKSGAWIEEKKTSGEGENKFPKPDDTSNDVIKEHTPSENDKYDQTTGKYYEWEKALKKGLSKKKEFGGFMKERKKTAFGFFDDSDRQGPHILSHITKRTGVEIGENMGLNINDIKDSKLVPNPKQVLHLTKKIETNKSIELDKKRKREYVDEYKRNYSILEDENAKSKKKKDALAMCIELNPLTVYKIGGETDHKEMKGKGESRNKSVDDFKKIGKWEKGKENLSDIETVDVGFEVSNDHDKTDVTDYIRNWGKVAKGDPPSPAPWDESDFSDDETFEVKNEEEKTDEKDESTEENEKKIKKESTE